MQHANEAYRSGDGTASASEMADRLKQQASGLKQQAKESASQVAERAQSAAESGKERVAERAHGVAEALHHVADNLRSEDQAEVATYTEKVADNVEKLAGFLRGRDLSSMVSDVKRFAQRQPALFLGGAFTAGLIAARFLKSSSKERQPSSDIEAGSAQSSFDRSGAGQPPTNRGGMGAGDDDQARFEEVTAPQGYGPAPGGYGPASAPNAAYGGQGTFGAEGAGGGPGNVPDADADESGASKGAR
jgi:hypothetical protein